MKCVNCGKVFLALKDMTKCPQCRHASPSDMYKKQYTSQQGDDSTLVDAAVSLGINLMEDNLSSNDSSSFGSDSFNGDGGSFGGSGSSGEW